VVDGSEVPQPQGRRNAGDVDHHQSVERIAERRINVEAEKRRVQPEILAEQHRNALAALDTLDQRVQFADVGDRCT